MRLMVAVSEAAVAGAAAPGAAAAGPTAAPTGLAFPAATTGAGGAASFPSAVLPTATAGGGGGVTVVPDVVGRTVGEARSMIDDAGLSVGTVTIHRQGAMLDRIIGVAWAQSENEATVVDQSPGPGAEANPGDSVDLVAEFSVPIPEPTSLLLFATGLALVVLVMTRRRSG
jgi:hypothetical protein